MVYSKTKIQNLIKKKLLPEFQKRLKVSKVLLFGSYASSKPHTWSDIDLAVISPDFKKMSKLERIGKLLESVHCIDFDRDIEPLGYTPEEYKNASPLTFLGEIKRTGKVVYEEI